MDNTQFVADLIDLLSRYNAAIHFTCSAASDTHGLYEDKMMITIDNTPVMTIDSWTVSAYNMTDTLITTQVP